MSKLNYIKLPKDKITDLETELYNFNSKVISLGLNREILTERNMKYLSDLLGRTIKLLREIREDD